MNFWIISCAISRNKSDLLTYILSLTDDGDEVISFVEEGNYTNYVLALTNGYVGSITINQKVITNLDLQTYYDETVGRTNFALTVADGIVAGDTVLVNISGYNSSGWAEGDSYALRLGSTAQGEETITLVENEYSSNYVLVETAGSVGTITINHSVILKNITFKASLGTWVVKNGMRIGTFKITSTMGLEEGDSVNIIIIITDATSGKIKLTKDNAALSNEKYLIGSGCYIDLDN